MHIYADPNGIPYNFTTESILVSGAVLPSSNNGTPITSITMRPNTTARSQIYSNYYIYESDTIRLKGSIPPNGWIFSFSLPCCRGFTNANFVGGSATLLKTTMYPSANRTLSSGCYDSSPQFMEMPKIQFFDNVDYITHNVATDFDGDSLIYLLDQPLAGTGNNSTKIPFRNGFSTSNYTGNGTLNGNVPYSIEPNSGNVAFSYTNSQGVNKFNRVITVESYRDGQKLSTITREMPLNVLNTSFVLKQPELSPTLSFNSFGIHYDTVMAGNALSIPITLLDTTTASWIDTMTLVPFGSSFSSDFYSATACNDPNDTSCATLSLPPALNNGIYPSRYEYQGTRAMYLNLLWNPTCFHLNANGGAKTHYFTFGYEVNYFSEPIFYRTIAITVQPNPALCNTVTSISSVKEQKNEIQLYPNPTNGRFKLKANYDFEDTQIKIRNSSGQLVKSFQYSSHSSREIEIPGSKGIYFVEFENPNGVLEVKKVIKL